MSQSKILHKTFILNIKFGISLIWLTKAAVTYFLIVLFDDDKHKFWSFPSRLKLFVESKLPLPQSPAESAP